MKTSKKLHYLFDSIKRFLGICKIILRRESKPRLQSIKCERSETLSSCCSKLFVEQRLTLQPQNPSLFQLLSLRQQ